MEYIVLYIATAVVFLGVDAVWLKLMMRPLFEREVVLVRDLRKALETLNPEIPAEAREQAIERITYIDFARSLIQHNREFCGFINGGVPVEWRDAGGEPRHAHDEHRADLEEQPHVEDAAKGHHDSAQDPRLAIETLFVELGDG